jgi:TonB family protein
VNSPLTWGALRPVILLPAYIEAWSEEKREVVLRHERAHIHRRDWLWQLFAQVVTAVFWFHPMAWLAASRLRQEAELATDDLVLAAGAESSDYAAQLLEVARHLGRRFPSGAVAVTMVRSSALTERITAILDAARVRARAGRALRAAIMAACACSVLLLGACATKVYRVGQGIAAPVPVTKPEPQYSEEARRAKLQGTVLLSMVINKQGKAEKIQIERKLGSGLDEKAVEAVQKWTFKPGTKDGKPVPVRANIEINFRLL